MTNYKFFWKSFSPFSNWYLSEFIDDNKISFNCVEQYMMYKKAELFKDDEIMLKILSTTNPKEIKELGRKVKGFKDYIWNNEKYKIVKSGCKFKFEQNSKLLKNLLGYKGFIFVEASPFDRIWGIGFEEKNALNNINKWGENLLGKILTELSNEL